MTIITARFHGVCDGCGLAIAPGDTIRHDFEDGQNLHAECRVATTPVKTAETCTSCWLIKPCECE